MKNLTEFEAAVSIYAAEQKRFFRFFKIWMVLALPYAIGLRLFYTNSWPTSKFVLFAIVIPLILVATPILEHSSLMRPQRELV
jgi:membrane protein YdbS with pleckstrin-like domain